MSIRDDIAALAVGWNGARDPGGDALAAALALREARTDGLQDHRERWLWQAHARDSRCALAGIGAHRPLGCDRAD